jgi:hypothetical protein
MQLENLPIKRTGTILDTDKKNVKHKMFLAASIAPEQQQPRRPRRRWRQQQQQHPQPQEEHDDHDGDDGATPPSTEQEETRRS